MPSNTCCFLHELHALLRGGMVGDVGGMAGDDGDALVLAEQDSAWRDGLRLQFLWRTLGGCGLRLL